MMRLIIFLFSLYCLTSVSLALSGWMPTDNRAPLPEVLIVDDFEDGEARKNPRWWRFGKMDAAIIPNTDDQVAYLGERSLHMSGKADQWVVGGVGTYFGINARQYNAVKLLIRGNGLQTGRLIIEMYDDDDGNYKVTTHEDYEYHIVKDDKFVYTLPIRWEGWKVVIITFDKFVDDNPSEGDNLWNPFKQKNGGGGLIQMQFVGIADEQNGAFNVDIDMIKFFKFKGDIPPPTYDTSDESRYFL